MTKDREEHQHHLKAEGLKDNIDNHATPNVLHWLPAAFLLAVIGIGAAVTVMTPSVRQWPAGKDVITGEAMLDYEENHLDAKVPWRDASVNLWGGLNYRLFGEARDGALIGKDGWLFTTEEYQTAKGDAQEIADKVAYIKRVRDELEKDGAKLVVALIPAKARIYAEQLRVPVPARNAPIYQDTRKALEEAGIPAPDLEAALRKSFTEDLDAGPVLLKTDTHWTPLGADVVARALAPAVQAAASDLPPASYEMTEKAPVSRSGDLLRYVPVKTGGPAPDTVREPEYTRTDEGGGGLLGDETLAVTLVGTSYSAETKDNVWHFAGALSQALDSEVLNAAQQGKGPIIPMREFLAGQDRQNNPPQVVVWEIPERFLRVAY